MATKAEVLLHAKNAATACFKSTDEAFVGEERVRAYVDDTDKVQKLLDRVGENLDDGRPRGFQWLADAIVRIAIQEAARISHGSNEMNFLVEFYRVKAWADFARNVQTQIAINRNADEQS